MKPFTTHQGLVIAIDRANIDTDAIIPKQFLTSIHKTGFGVNLFDEWRYKDYGKPGMDNSQRPLNPDFPLNQARFKGGSILLARENFGCGSSREHAVWALDDFGIRAVISSSYSDIFYNNCFKNGVLPIRLSVEEIDQLFKLVEKKSGLEINIDLEEQSVTPQLEGKALTDAMHFEIDSFRKNMLVNGLDDISLTLQHEADIKAYEARRKEIAPWLFS